MRFLGEWPIILVWKLKLTMRLTKPRLTNSCRPNKGNLFIAICVAALVLIVASAVRSNLKEAQTYPAICTSCGKNM